MHVGRERLPHGCFLFCRCRQTFMMSRRALSVPRAGFAARNNGASLLPEVLMADEVTRTLLHEPNEPNAGSSSETAPRSDAEDADPIARGLRDKETGRA